MAPKGKEKPKPSSATQTLTIEDRFKNLNRHIQRLEYAQAVKVSDEGDNIAFIYFYTYTSDANMKFIISFQYSDVIMACFIYYYLGFQNFSCGRLVLVV